MTDSERDQLENEVRRLRRERNAHQMDESDYITAVVDLIVAEKAEAVRLAIGEDEPEVTKRGKRVSTSKSVLAFQIFYRNKLRAEQRKRAGLTNQQTNEDKE